jgi:hypothetical protein
MADMYAWNDIACDKGNIVKGSKVTKSGLGVDDEGWEALIRGGSIRPKKFPAPPDYQGSVLDWYRDQLKEAQAMSSEEEVEAEMSLAEISAAEPESSK